MEKGVAFVANYYLTEVFQAIVDKLDAEYVVYWLVFSKWDLQKLVDASVSSEHIVYIPMEPVIKENLTEFTYIPYNELIHADRVLRLNPLKGKMFLRQLADEINQFFDITGVMTVFGESTWAHERVIGRIASQKGRKYYVPHTVRFPNERFAFFEGEYQDKLLYRKAPSQFECFDTLPEWESPSYVEINDSILNNQRSWAFKIIRLTNFILARNIDKNSVLNIVGFKSRLFFGVNEEFNKLTYRYLVKRCSLADTKNLRYYVYGLHKQPESSIDVQGRFYEDQFNNIRVLQRALPDGYSLIVKEHSNAIGDRNYNFYRQVAALEDVILVSENVNTRELISSSKGVFTVSGTIAYEAAYLGVRSYTFVPMFFNALPLCSWCSLDVIRSTRTLIDLEYISKQGSLLEAMNHILSQSYQGIFTDAKTNPRVLLRKNIYKLTEAFVAVLKE